MHNWYRFTSSLQVKLGFDYGSHHEPLSSLLGGFVQHIVWTEIGDAVKKKGVHRTGCGEFYMMTQNGCHY